MSNLANLPLDAESPMILGRTIDQLLARLDALLLVLKSCTADECRFPWKQLHPHSGKTRVMTLVDALEFQHDAFYNAQPRVAFTECSLGQLLELEGPMWLGGHGSMWPAWV